MKKVEANTLEEAYRLAAYELSCSVTDINYEVIQYPSKGILGLLKKKAIIVASCKKVVKEVETVIVEKIVEKEVVKEVIVEKKELPKEKIETPKKIIEEKKVLAKDDDIVDSFFAVDKKSMKDDKKELEEKEPEHKELVNEEVTYEEETIVYDELALLIENELKSLLSKSCFSIDVVEVNVRDNTALIFIDGDDAALLIGKEGYRYNALSYMIFNWLHTKYELFIKLEIAEFLTSQQEMIRNYIKPVIENVEKNGRGKTRTLDGILVQIALEQLREVFPNKYVAIKTGKNGKKFVVVNEFNKKKNV